MDYGKEVAAILAVIILVGIVAVVSTEGGNTAKTNKQSAVVDKTVPKEAITRCVNLCKDMSKVIRLNSGRCLSPDIDGYSCAVIVNEEGHCVRSLRGSKEIDLDRNCKLVGVVKWEG